MKRGFVLIVLLLPVLVPVARAADRARNIFDDDWTPPKATATPHGPTTVKPVLPVDPSAHRSASTEAKVPTEATSKSLVQPPPTPTRLTVPTKPAQAAVRKVMRDVFAAQLADRSIPARRKLGVALLAQVDKSADAPVDQFVLLAAAIDSAIDAVDLPAALRAADRMAEEFDVDGLGVKADAALRLGPRSGQPDSAAENVYAAIDLAADLARVGDFATAARVCAALQPAAATNPALRKQLMQRQRELGQARDAADRFAKDLARLKDSPNDPAANLATGRYTCFVKEDWDDGLPLLAKGSEPSLKTQALLELANPQAPDDLAQVADGWWDLAHRQTDVGSKAAVTAHAVVIYRRAIDGLSGLRKAQAEKRIAEYAAATRYSKAVELLPGMQGKSSGVEQGVVLLKPGDRISTPNSYTPSVAFRIVAQTDDTNLRIAYAADEIIFNWELNPSELRIGGGPAGGHHKGGAGAIPKKTWVTIELEVTKDAMTISVDGEQRQSVTADFAGVDQKLSIFAVTSPVMVRSVQMFKP